MGFNRNRAMTIFLSFLFAALNTWAAVVFHKRSERIKAATQRAIYANAPYDVAKALLKKYILNASICVMFLLLAIVCFLIGLFEVLN